MNVIKRTLESDIINTGTTLRLFIANLFHLGVDSLTGLKNISWYEARKASRFISSNFETYIYLDINGLKRENDRHGHPAGDRLLQNFGADLKAFSKRYNFTAVRLHGDEFLMFSLAPLNNWETELMTLKRDERCSYGVGPSEELAEAQMRKDKDFYYKTHLSLERRQADRRQQHTQRMLRLDRMSTKLREKQLQFSQQLLEKAS